MAVTWVWEDKISTIHVKLYWDYNLGIQVVVAILVLQGFLLSSKLHLEMRYKVVVE